MIGFQSPPRIPKRARGKRNTHWMKTLLWSFFTPRILQAQKRGLKGRILDPQGNAVQSEGLRTSSPEARPAWSVALNCGKGIRFLKAEVNALERLQIVRGRNS